jgi:transposase
MPISTPAQIRFPLDIPHVDVLGTKQTRDGQFFITVESRKETTKCGVCKQEISCNYGRGEAVTLRHLPILGQETYIVIQPRRAQCPTCLHQPTTTQKLNWYKQRSPHTQSYDQYLMKQLVGSSVKDVSLKEKVGYDAVLGALQRQVAYKKGRKSYRAIITARQDDDTVIVLAVLNNRKKRQ